MRIRNILSNWWFGIKPLQGEGMLNVGITKDNKIVKMDWEKLFTYTTPRYKLTRRARAGDKIIHTTIGSFKIRKNGRLMIKIGRGESAEVVRVTPL